VTKQEVIRHLRRWRYDPQHRWGKQGRTMANVAALANVDKEWLKKLRDYGYVHYPALLARVTRAVEMIENGEVRFVLHQPMLATSGGNRALVNARGEPRWRIEWVNVPKRRPPPQDRITRADAHASWARCRTCQGDKWTAVEIAGADWYACNNCCGPLQWRGMGAKKIDAKPRLEMHESRMFEDFSQLRKG
jgi:hypothetical protein